MLLGDIDLWTEGEGTQRRNTSLFYEVSFLFFGVMLSSMTFSRSFDETTGSTVVGRLPAVLFCLASSTAASLLVFC
jgi:hypothetical protein